MYKILYGKQKTALQKERLPQTEMEGFEPSHRGYRPAAFRVRSLQPLGYISLVTSGILPHNFYLCNEILQEVFCCLFPRKNATEKNASSRFQLLADGDCSLLQIDIHLLFIPCRILQEQKIQYIELRND